MNSSQDALQILQLGTAKYEQDLLDGRLLFAIPKKATLWCVPPGISEIYLNKSVGADIQFRRHNRLDVCVVMNHPIALVFLPAADIPSFVGNGDVDLGITGHDVIIEANIQDHITEVQRLGFGKCALQVQTLEDSPFKSVEDLAGKRVVTSFDVIAGAYFAEIDERLNLTGDSKTKIQYVGGSVEAACALGLADGIGVERSNDISESGDTMRAAGLHPIATVLQTEAVLIKSNVPHRAHHAPLIDLIANRIAGVVAAGKYVVCEYNIRRESIPQAATITPGKRAPTISPLEEEGWVAISSLVEKKSVANTMDQLMKIGAEDILVFNLDNCRV
ncbi:ATP phosphoribosyltransferase-domain-containing protein [Suillus spraguei]|nr:ATP phosphoribosyltransferase-domain-containing protein [Suillus spraguei]